MSDQHLDLEAYVSDIRAFALTEEFTWNEWTFLRDAYLRMRHAWRYHREDWQTFSGFGAYAVATLIKAVDEAVGVFKPVEVDPRFPHDEVHTLLPDTLNRMLLGCTRSGVRRTIAFWESGLLPLLILRRLELEILDRMNLTEPVNRPPVDAMTEIRFGIESWVPIGSRLAVAEGRLEDVAYQEIAHDESAVVSVESLDGSHVYFAASAGYVIGQNLLASPVVGDTVRLRTWRIFNTWSSGAGVGDVESANRSWAEYSIEDLPEGDVMTRTEVLLAGGPEAGTDWRVWSWDDVVAVAGWARPQIDECDDDASHTPQSQPVRVDPSPLHILRTEPDEWVRDQVFGSDGHSALGEQTEWAFNRPALYRLVAGQHPGMSFQRLPRRGESYLEGACAYWSAALELLVYNLGWSSPSLGVSWWLRAGRPRTDRLLSVLDEIWFQDGEFDALHQWLREGWGGRGPWNSVIRANVVPAVNERSAEAAGPSHLLGDSFHLNDHSSGPISRSASNLTSVHDASGEVTVLVRSGLGGWYSAVAACDPRTEVHLVVPWIGRIGVFRRSPWTQLWHATSEDIHLAGNSLR